MVCPLSWLKGMHPILTRRAYSGFCLNGVGSRTGPRRSLPGIARTAPPGIPVWLSGLWQVVRFLAYWITPRGFQGEISAAVGGRRSA